MESSIPAFAVNTYRIQHELSLIKEKFKVTDGAGNPMLWVVTPSISLKKEFHVYTDEAGSNEVLNIKIHKLIEMAETWDVSEPNSGSSLGTIKSEVLKSMMRPSWQILSANNQLIAEVSENLAGAITGGLVPRKFIANSNETQLAEYDQTYLSLMLQFSMNFEGDTNHVLDRRLGLAAGIVIAHKALTENHKTNNPMAGGFNNQPF
ncbi:MAG: hypothetical protein ACHQUB_03405 [Candidatus Saccharimonadia bacterium]